MLIAQRGRSEDQLREGALGRQWRSSRHTNDAGRAPALFASEPKNPAAAIFSGGGVLFADIRQADSGQIAFLLFLRVFFRNKK
jgi:hypothetical protein